MKKIFAVCILVAIVVMCFASCGNKAFLDPGSFKFEHVHVTDHVEGHCFNIEKWWDNESGIEVRTTNGDGMFLSEGTYQLFESADACPYCD